MFSFYLHQYDLIIVYNSPDFQLQNQFFEENFFSLVRYVVDIQYSVLFALLASVGEGGEEGPVHSTT